MKRILIFSTAYLPLIGGAEIAVKEITDRLGGDFVFDLICARIKRNLPKQEKVGKINVYRAGWGWGKLDKFLLPWRGAALAEKLHRQEPYDIAWAIMASFGGLAALFFKNKLKSVPYVLTLQEGDTPEHIASRALWLGPYYKRMFTRADLITAISNYLKEFALAQGAKSQIAIVPNGVDINKFQTPGGNKQELRSRLGITIQEKVIVTVSRLVEKNGIADLIKAMSHLPAEVKLLILGSGSLERELKARVKNSGLDDRVLFLGDVPHDKVPQFLAIADVFVRPSLAEGLGNVFLEAMAAGVPIIGTKVGGIPDFLRDPSVNSGQAPTGLFCEVSDSQSIAEKINLLLADHALHSKLIINGRVLVQEQYSWNKIAAQMKETFTQLTL